MWKIVDTQAVSLDEYFTQSNAQTAEEWLDYLESVDYINKIAPESSLTRKEAVIANIECRLGFGLVYDTTKQYIDDILCRYFVSKNNIISGLSDYIKEHKEDICARFLGVDLNLIYDFSDIIDAFVARVYEIRDWFENAPEEEIDRWLLLTDASKEDFYSIVLNHTMAIQLDKAIYDFVFHADGTIECGHEDFDDGYVSNGSVYEEFDLVSKGSDGKYYMNDFREHEKEMSR